MNTTYHYNWYTDPSLIPTESLPFLFVDDQIHIIDLHLLRPSAIPDILSGIRRMSDRDTTIHITVPVNDMWNIGNINALMIYHGLTVVSTNKSDDSVAGVYAVKVPS